MKKMNIENFFQKEDLKKAKKYLEDNPSVKQKLEELFLEHYTCKSIDFDVTSTIKNLQNQVYELSVLYHQLKNYPTIQLDPKLLQSLDKAETMIVKTKSQANNLRLESEIKYDIDRIVSDIRVEIQRWEIL